MAADPSHPTREAVPGSSWEHRLLGQVALGLTPDYKHSPTVRLGQVSEPL